MLLMYMIYYMDLMSMLHRLASVCMCTTVYIPPSSAPLIQDTPWPEDSYHKRGSEASIDTILEWICIMLIVDTLDLLTHPREMILINIRGIAS